MVMEIQRELGLIERACLFGSTLGEDSQHASRRWLWARYSLSMAMLAKSGQALLFGYLAGQDPHIRQEVGTNGS